MDRAASADRLLVKHEGAASIVRAEGHAPPRVDDPARAVHRAGLHQPRELAEPQARAAALAKDLERARDVEREPAVGERRPVRARREGAVTGSAHERAEHAHELDPRRDEAGGHAVRVAHELKRSPARQHTSPHEATGDLVELAQLLDLGGRQLVRREARRKIGIVVDDGRAVMGSVCGHGLATRSASANWDQPDSPGRAARAAASTAFSSGHEEMRGAQRCGRLRSGSESRIRSRGSSHRLSAFVKRDFFSM